MTRRVQNAAGDTELPEANVIVYHDVGCGRCHSDRLRQQSAHPHECPRNGGLTCGERHPARLEERCFEAMHQHRRPR
ncbi:MAG TPA: hypothetical protein VK464_26290 [Symbiobacteriaceae bacterium]|nr:hypothetical protein [Symbiobacteriaceae bacterium]